MIEVLYSIIKTEIVLDGIISQSLIMGKWMLFIILGMAILIMYNSPIENENKPHLKEKKQDKE